MPPSIPVKRSSSHLARWQAQLPQELMSNAPELEKWRMLLLSRLLDLDSCGRQTCVSGHHTRLAPNQIGTITELMQAWSSRVVRPDPGVPELSVRPQKARRRHASASLGCPRGRMAPG